MLESKDPFGKFRANLYRQHAYIQTIVPENVCKKAGNYATETVIINRPGSMLARRPGTEIFTAHQDTAAVRWVVQHKILLRAVVRVVTPVAEKIITKTDTLGSL